MGLRKTRKSLPPRLPAVVRPCKCLKQHWGTEQSRQIVCRDGRQGGERLREGPGCTPELPAWVRSHGHPALGSKQAKHALKEANCTQYTCPPLIIQRALIAQRALYGGSRKRNHGVPPCPSGPPCLSGAVVGTTALLTQSQWCDTATAS